MSWHNTDFRISRNRHRHIQSPLSIYCSLHLWNLAVVMFVRARFWLARCAESAYLQWLVVLCFHMMYPAESYVETTHSPKQCCVLWAKGDKTHPDNKRQQATMIIPLLLHVTFHCNYPLKSSQKAPPPRRERGTSAFSRVFFVWSILFSASRGESSRVLFVGAFPAVATSLQTCMQ